MYSYSMETLDFPGRERLTELLAALVSIPSITNREQQIAQWTYDHLQHAGLRDVQRLPVEESGDTIVGWLGEDKGGPTLLLNFHLDTFDVFNGWDTDPFKPTIQGNRLYGLGAIDMKAGAACILGAVEALVHSRVRLKGRVLVAGTTDEENWSRGVHALIQSGALRNCIGAMVPEPTPYGKLRIGARGRHVITITLHGRSMHIAYGKGINAVVDAAKIIAVLNDDEKLKLAYSREFDLPSGLGVIGVQGGGTMILAPELAKVIVDRHLLPGETLEGAIAHLHDLIRRAGIESAYEIAWDARPTPAPGAFIVPPQSQFVQVVKRQIESELGREVQLTIARSVADVNHIAVHGGVPTITCGPWGGNICEANEWVDLESLAPIARVHVSTVMAMLGTE